MFLLRTSNFCKRILPCKPWFLTSSFLRFCMVGVVCTGVDTAIYYVVRQFASYQIALVCGYCLSLCLNYYLTIHWTFRVKDSLKNGIGIVLSHLFNLFVVRMGLMFIFVNFFHLSDSLAYIPTLIISVTTSYLIVRAVVSQK